MLGTPRALLLAAVTAIAVACGGGTDSAGITPATLSPTASTAAPTVAPTPPETSADGTEPPIETDWPPSQDLLDEAVLPITAMPSGWAEVRDEREEDDPCGVSVHAILGIEEVPSGEAWYAEDEEYGPMVFLFTGVLPPTDVDVLTTLKDALLACEPPDDDGWSTRYSELSFPEVGEQSIAIRITRSNGDTTVYLDVVQARVGDVVVQVAGADVFGDSTAVLEQFVQPQLDRAVAVLG